MNDLATKMRDRAGWTGTDAIVSALLINGAKEIERQGREVAELLYVVRKAAEWDADNTDNADLAALGAYARAALSKCHAQGDCQHER